MHLSYCYHYNFQRNQSNYHRGKGAEEAERGLLRCIGPPLDEPSYVCVTFQSPKERPLCGVLPKNDPELFRI